MTFGERSTTKRHIPIAIFIIKFSTLFDIVIDSQKYRSNSGLFKVTCLQLFRMTRDLRCQNVFGFFGFFCDVNQNLKAPPRKKKFMVCDLWLVDFDPFCVFLCFKVCCFWTSKFGRVFLKSAVSFSLALSFFYLFTLKHGKFRFPRWNCFYGASKSRRKADMGGWKGIGTFPPTFIFAASARYCHLYFTSKDWML